MNILFVCTGNTCRSPMAEGIMKKILADNGDDRISVSSRGLASGGGGASQNAITVASELGADISSHTSRQLTVEDVETSDLILTVTSTHAQAIKSALPTMADKVVPLAEFTSANDIVDPYGGNLEVYRRCASDLYEACKEIYNKIRSDNQ